MANICHHRFGLRAGLAFSSDSIQTASVLTRVKLSLGRLCFFLFYRRLCRSLGPVCVVPSDAFHFSTEACCLCAREPPDSCETMVTPVQISLRCPAGEAAHSALATGLSAPPLRGNQIIAEYWRSLLSGEVSKPLGFGSREPEALTASVSSSLLQTFCRINCP